MITFLVNLLAAASQDKRIRKFLATVVIPALVKALKEALMPDLASLNLVFGASLLKKAVEKLPGVENITETAGQLATDTIEAIKRDPDIAGLSNIIDLSEIGTKWLGRFGL